MDLEDPATQRFLLRHVRVGVVVSLVVLPAVLLYLLATPDGPNRLPLAIVLGVFALLTLAMHWLVPWERLLLERRGLWAIGAWTASTVILADLAAAFDGGSASPFAGLVFVPLIAGAISYPPRVVLALGALCVVGHGILVVVAGEPLGPVAFLEAVVLAVAAVMCAQSSANHRGTAAQLRRTAQDLERLASVDGLTGCANHRTFQEHLHREVSAAHRDGHDVSLLLADLDHFKAVNDTHGHPVGDEVLRQVAVCLRGAVRSDDIIGRIGGEEFTILLPATPLDTAVEVAERARAAVGAIAAPVRLTTSIGVASLPVLAATADDLLAAADRGLYRAKNSGRDRVVVADRATRPVAARPVEDVADRVRRVLDEGRLSAVFQPVVEIRSGRVVGYEALARVEGSSLAPPGWLELAGGAGLRDELEIAMWDAALDAWTAAAAHDDLMLWLNISPDVLVGGLPWTRRNRLPARVVLELSELAPVRSYPRLRAVLDEWREQPEREVRFAIDDVGAGHANMRHIIELAPDVTKLDRSLVDEVADNQAKQAVVRGLVGFCGDIGSALVAEGVEHERCAATLGALGVEWAQGWYFGGPHDLVPAGHVIRPPTRVVARRG